MKASNLIKIAILSLSAPAFAVVAQDAAAPMQRQKYTFKCDETPEGMAVYACGVYTHAGNHVNLCKGQLLAKLGQDIIDLAFSPAGTNFVVVSIDKKENDAAVFGANEEQSQQFQLKNKKFGNPTAAAYTPDARNLIIATDHKLNIFDARTFELVDSFSIPVTPIKMEMSSNGYFLALNDGKKVCVLNYEQKRPRQTFNIDAPITDAKFNNDASEIGILTDDGMLTIYDTRNFIIKKTLDFDGGLSFDYNEDGKYAAVVTSPETIVVVNLLDPEDRETFHIEEGNVCDVEFVPDSFGYPLMFYLAEKSVNANRMNRLSPYYGKLVSEEANLRLNEWMKMMPDETIEQYNARVSDENRKRQLQLYEDEASTRFANDLLSMSTITLGKYDRTNQMLQVDFDNMPSIMLPVPESDLGSFSDTKGLEFRNAKYGVMNDDKFELIYAEVFNPADGKTYTYNNIDRVPLNFVESDDNFVSIEVIQQQQMEEIRLQEIKQQVVEEAKSQNVISEHTNISVDSRVDTDYDADGNKILNYNVKFTYQVDPEFTAHEDFAPGKYRAEQSGAASSMLQIVKQAFEGDFAQYLKAGKKLVVKISGTADATPIVSKIKYDGCYGEFVDEPVYKNGQLSGLTVTSKELITQNEQLAFLRAVGVKNYLENNVEKLNDMKTDYQYHIGVSEGKGSEFRRITTEFIFVDAF